MDEADKYKQRLEAIAEKLRLQEEQERARRELEEERLRLQQLKRKSLRDQWLMEGAPMSPASSDSQSPRSPLWGSEAQEMEEHIDHHSCGLQSESQRLTEEEEKKPTENSQTQEAAEMGEADAETCRAGDGDHATQMLLPDETPTLLTNGRKEASVSPDCSDCNRSPSGGRVAASASRDCLRMSLSAGEPAPNPSVGVEEEEEEEEEEETAEMAAKCAIVTDEEEGEPEVTEGQPEDTQSGTEDRREAVEEEIKREAAEEKQETTQLSAEISPTAADGEEEKPPVVPLGDTVVPADPACSQSDSICERETDGAAAATQEEAGTSTGTQEPPTLPNQFQEVFPVDPQSNTQMEEIPGEQDSLLSQAKGLESNTEPSAAQPLVSTETRSPNRASHEEKSKTPKHRNGLCCTII